MSVFETKLARFRAEQERKKMSKSYRREVAKKLKDAIAEATDPKVIADLANVLAKYLPKPKPPRRRPGTTVGPIKTKEPTIDELVVILRKRDMGQKLTEAEEQAASGVDMEKLVAAMEKNRREARKAENGGAAEVG